MHMMYSGVSELYGGDDVGHGVLLVTALAYDGEVPMVDCWMEFGVGGLDFRLLTAFVSALAESAIEFM